MLTFMFFATAFFGLRKFWKWVKLRNEQIDYENAFIAGLRQDIAEGKIKWPLS